MQSIILKNFKSYEQQSLNDLNSRINIVLGSNGQGKSNFFKAISFLFTDRFTINRAEFNGTLYRGARTENPEILVQVNFSQKSEEQKSYKISKSWTNYTNEDLRINDKSKNREQYENFIDSFGLSYTSPYNIVQQGKISQIAQMSQNQLYLLLQDTAGVKRFMKKHQDAHSNLQKIQNDLNEVQQSLKFLKDKVSQLQDKKNEYEFYSVEQKVRKIKKKRQLNNYMNGIAKTLEKLKEKHHEVLKDLEETKVKEKDLMYQIEQKQRNLKVLTEKAVFYEKEHSEDVEQFTNVSKKSLSSKKKELKQLEKKIASEQKALQQSQDKLASLQKQLNVYREKYESIKVEFQIGESKDAKKTRQAYQAKIQTQKQAIKSMQQELKKVTKMHSQFNMVSYSTEQKQSSLLQAQLSPILQQLRKLKVQQIQLGRNKINIQCQIQTLLGRKKNLDDLVKQILPMVDFRLLKWLQENKVDGVYGYLIEHLKIDGNVAFAYELAGLSKLCTLLVEDDKVAAKVVQINKKIHGKNINILPLSYIKSQAIQKRSYPKMENVFSLINEEWIKIAASQKISVETKSTIQKVVNNTFAKYALVEDYKTALKVSKEYNLNCITADREIVYADAYMCKVGREQVYEKGKIELFEMLQNMNRELNMHKNQLSIIERKQVDMQNQQIELINKKQKFQLRINQLHKTIEEAKKVQAVIQKLQAKMATLNESIQRSNRIVQQYQTAIKNMQNNVKTKFKEEDFKKAESEYFVQKSKVEKIFNQNYEKQKNLSNLLKDLETVKKEVTNIEQRDSGSPDLQSKQQILKDLEKQKNKLEQESSKLNKQLSKLIEKKSSLKEKQVGLLAELTVEEQNQKDVGNKIQGLGDINPQEEQQIQQLSHSLSRKLTGDSINAKKRLFYTARDKVFFTKITEYINKVTFYSDSTGKIRKQKQRLLQYMQQTENQAKQYMKSFVANFEKHFIRYFLKIVPDGKADLRTKIYTQKIKGITKNGYSLEIKVSFNEEEGIRRWSEFSGGQKTILALCIILAIQKCQPTPFCVLDEVDAALDPFYASKIVDIIVEESQFCQYFITSFKKSMLDFPQNITNYYLVKSVNRISNITKVEKSEVQGFIDEIAQ